jgi:hypothetical protein
VSSVWRFRRAGSFTLTTAYRETVVRKRTT